MEMKTQNTTATHTPGPWRIDGEELIPGFSDSGPLLHAVIRSEGERWTALVEIEDAEGRENARLIAAAPAMLEALYKTTAALQIALANYASKDSEQHGRLLAIRLEAEAVARDAEGRT